MNKYFKLIALLPLLISCNYNSKKEYKVEDYEAKLKDGTSLSFKDDNFKIMQLSDLHFGIEANIKEQEKLLNKMVEDAKPDLIVITGDSFLNATKNIVNSFINIFDSFNIPYAFTYGNHDLQGLYDSYYINRCLLNSKNAIFIDYKDDNIKGLANYYINIKDQDNKTNLYRLYILDSNSYYFNGYSYLYDIIYEEQIAHIENINKNYNDSSVGLAFYHIPIYEYIDAYNLLKDSNDPSKFKGEQREDVAVGYKRNDVFSRFKNINIKAHFVGHDHINYTDMLYNEVILSYGVKSSNLVYHDDDILGYKLINLPLDKSKFLDLDNINTYKDYKYE